jgi:hypothetical protein
MSNTNLQLIKTPFQYQRNANGICKSFTYYPEALHYKKGLISLWSANDDLIAQPVQIKTSFISKITNLQQDNDFMKIAITDGENEKYIFAIYKKYFCGYSAEQNVKNEEAIKSLEIVNEFLQAIYTNPGVSLNIEKTERDGMEYWCQIVQC